MVPLSVDWLGLTLRLKTLVGDAPPGHRWAFYSGTNVWHSRWCLYNEYGEKVFTLLFQPKSRGFLKADQALFEVANEWLYHGVGFQGALELLRRSCDFEVMGISRLDLAADFNPDFAQMEVIESLFRQRMYVSGKQNGLGWWTMVHDDCLPLWWQGKCPKDISWGHKTSDVRWKLYYKSNELREGIKGAGWNKPYIVDMWRELGMDIRNVWRLEVSIHNCNTFDFMGEKLTYDRFLSSGSDLFQALYSSRFQVRMDEGHKDKSNDTIVNFLPVGGLRSAFRVRRRDVIVEHNSSIPLLRHLVRDVLTEQVVMNEPVRESVLATIGVVIERDGLHRYFRELVGEEYDSWCEWVRVQGYYFGQQVLTAKDDSEVPMEKAMLESGLIVDHTALSALNPQCLNDNKYNQLKLFE